MILPMMLSMMSQIESLFDSTFCSRLGLMLLHSLWQVAVLAMVAWGVDRFWLKRSVERSYAVCVAVLVLALVAMPVTFWGLGSGREWVTSRAAEAVSPGDAPALDSSSLQAAPSEVIGSQANRPAAFPASTETLSTQVLATTVWQRAAPWLVVAYGLGVVLMLVRLVRAWVSSNRLGSRAEKIVDGPLVETLRSLAGRWSMRVVPMLAETHEMVLPKVVGLARPMILLPTAAIAGLSPDELEMILAHELAHVRRHDMWVNLLQRLAEVVLFFNPALWLLSRRISTLREYCCDEMTCQLMANAELKNEPQLRYATALLHVAELAQPNTAAHNDLAALAATGRSPSELRRRVARLFGEPMREPVRVTRGALATVAALLLVLGFGSTVVSSTKEPQESKQTVELKGSFSTQAASILSELLKENPVPFISEQDRAEIRLDFANVIDGFVASKSIDLANVPDARKAAILTSMRDRGAYFLRIGQYQHLNPRDQNSVYLGFSGRLKTLQWKIFMALNRGELSEAEIVRRTEQQAWMLDIVQELPDDRSLWRKAELDRLAVWFSDPLCTTFDRPLSDEHFSQFQQTIEDVLEGKQAEGASAPPGNKRQKLLPGMSFRFLNLAVRTQWHHPPGADPFDFPTFDNDKIHGFGTHPLRLSFASMGTNNGRSEFLEVFEKSFSAIDATTDWFGSPPKNAHNRDAALRWMRSQGKGDFAYDRKGLFAVRDARLLRLDVTNWFGADQTNNDALREQIESHGTDRIPLDDVFQAYRTRYDTEPVKLFHGPYIGVLTLEGNLAVVHVENFNEPDRIIVRTRIRHAPHLQVREVRRITTDNKSFGQSSFLEGLQIAAGEGVIVRLDPQRRARNPILPDDLSVHAAYQFNPHNVIAKFKKTFDNRAGYKDAFANVLQGLEYDPYGPRINVKEEFIANLTGLITVLTFAQNANTKEPPRYLVAVKSNNEKALSSTVEKFMCTDLNASRIIMNGRPVWKIAAEQAESSFASVVLGHLFISNDAELMQKVFAKNPVAKAP